VCPVPRQRSSGCAPFSCFAPGSRPSQEAVVCGTPLLPWMVCRWVLGTVCKQPRFRKRAARRSVSCGCRRALPARRSERFRPGVPCAAVGQRSREQDTRNVHRHCFLAERRGHMRASGARLLPAFRVCFRRSVRFLRTERLAATHVTPGWQRTVREEQTS
jgi:hypothetical protein